MRRLLIVLLLLCGICPAAVVKGQAGRMAFAAVDSTGAYKTGDAANITAYRAIDGATSYTALTDTSAAEAGTSGIYWFDLAADDTNGDVIIYYATSTTSGVTLDRVVVSTIVPADYKATGFALASDWTAARAGYVDKLNVTGTLANTDNASSFKATGFSTHSAADVWTVAARALTDKTGFSLATAPPAASDISTQILSDWVSNNLIEASGSDYIFTTAALANAPAGSGSLTAEDVWTYATRALTDKSGYSLTTAPPAAEDIAAAVWSKDILEDDTTNAAYVLSSTFNNTGEIPADVWTYAARGLTDKSNFYLGSSQTFSTTGSVATISNTVSAILAPTIHSGAVIPTVSTVTNSVNVTLDSTDINSIVAGIMSKAIDSTVTFQDAQKIMLAVLSGQTTGGGTTELKFYDPTGTKARLTATVDDDGNRTIVIKNVTD